MAKFQPGVSGNPNGRPKGAVGFKKRLENKMLNEDVMYSRLLKALNLMDDWHEKRQRILADYVDGKGAFPLD